MIVLVDCVSNDFAVFDELVSADISDDVDVSFVFKLNVGVKMIGVADAGILRHDTDNEVNNGVDDF